MYKIKLTKNAVKQLNKLDITTYNRIYNKLQDLKSNPRPVGCLKLSDSNAYRIRIGSYRIIYEIIDNLLIVEIYHIAHRREAY